MEIGFGPVLKGKSSYITEIFGDNKAQNGKPRGIIKRQLRIFCTLSDFSGSFRALQEVVSFILAWRSLTES